LRLITEQQIYDVYILQSRNVRKLSKVKDNLCREINRDLKTNNHFQVEVKTKILTLLYSAWSEAQFVQILHTPKGFFPRLINNIENDRKQHGIISGWNLMIELAIVKVGDINSSSDLSMRQDKLKLIIKENIEKQSILRNKIAHGQWVHALNRDHTGESPFTSELNSLDYVAIDKLFEVHKYLGLIIRDLVQSPQKGFHRNYWSNLVSLEGFLDKTKEWTVETRKRMLGKRPIKYKNG
jgi:hypothetical protein